MNMEENENSADLGISSTLSGESEQRFHVKNKMTPSKCKPAHPTWCKKKLDFMSLINWCFKSYSS